MLKDNHTWLSIDQAARHFGYHHPESLRRRLRDLREQNYVADIGIPPERYKVAKRPNRKKIVIYWLNPKTSLLRSDAPRNLLNPKVGKRPRKTASAKR
ncbi:MAG: hypothetical protein WBW94_08650 [Anaerolineales bacterium]